MKLLFWISVGLIAYTFFIYPVLLAILSGLAQLARDLRYAVAHTDRRRRNPGEPPTVSFIVAAHNEEAVIAAKMRNCAALDYSAGRLEILVGCDGCTDRTVELARSAGLPNARVFAFERSGKPATLNRLAERATGDILVFSDANTMYRPEAVRSLVRHFGQEEVGAACGEVRLSSPTGEPLSEGVYWRYECVLKFLEGRLNMLVGANGAIFAMRRRLFRPLPPRTINDDFLMAMNVRSGGHRVVYDPAAVAYEDAAEDFRQEFRRRVRIGRGNLRALRHTWKLLSPAAGLVALSYWSHKIFRWVVPFAILTSVAAALWLAREPFFAVSGGLGLLFILAAGLGYFRQGESSPSPLIRFPCYFLLMNTALLVGFIRDAVEGRDALWSPTARSGVVGDGS